MKKTKLGKYKFQDVGNKLYKKFFEKSSKVRILGAAAVFLIYIFFWNFMDTQMKAETENLGGLFTLNGILILG